MISKSVKDQEYLSIKELLDKNSALETELQALKMRLEEAEELKRAISEGDLDALIIPAPQGKLIFTLDSADRAYRVLVETMNEGTVTFAEDGTILYCNRRFAELVRMRPQAIVGTSIYRFIESEDEHTFKALQNQRTSAGEINLRAVGGISVPVYLSISSLQSEESQNAWCLVATDLTEQKKNEEIVSAGRLAKSIIEQAAEAIVVCDMEGKITHFSNAVSRICECDPAFQKLEDIMDLRFSEGEDAGKSIFPVSSAMRGFSILGVGTTFELKYGKKFHLLLNSGPLKNSDGGVIGCVVTLTDITELKQLEEKTRRRAEEIETIMETAPVAIWMNHDPKCYNITGNRMANEFYDAEPGENVSANATSSRRFFYKGCELTADELPMQQASLKDIDVRNKELDVLLPKGEWRTLLGSASPLHDAKGNVRGSIGTFIDITERKQAEKELLKSEKSFKLLSEANSTLLLSKEPENMIKDIAEKLMHHLNCDVFLNYVFDETGGRLHLNACSGISERIAKEIEWLEKGSAICGCVAREGCRIVSRDVQHNEDKRADLVKSMGIQAYACQPLRIGETTISTLSFGTKSRKNFTEDELALMSTVADQLSVAIERKRAEDVIKTIAINLARAERLANLGHWDWTLTTNHIRWSENHFNIFGYPVDLGTESYEMWRARVHPEDIEGIERVLRESREKDTGYNYNYRLLMPDGTVRYIHSEAGKPMKDASGKPVRWFGIVQDITEQKRVEDALRES